MAGTGSKVDDLIRTLLVSNVRMTSRLRVMPDSSVFTEGTSRCPEAWDCPTTKKKHGWVRLSDERE